MKVEKVAFNNPSGGMEMLFKNQKVMKVKVPEPEGGQVLTVQMLLNFIRDHVQPDRPELFFQNSSM